MSSNVQVVFWGEVLAGFEPDDVKRRIARALKLDEVRVAQLFTGTRTVLKRSVDEATGQLYVDKLAQLGALVHLEPSDSPPTTAFPTLPELSQDDAPAPPPWGMPPRPPQPGPATAKPAPAAPAEKPPATLALQPVEAEITCPNCGERQSKRLLCRKCATNIEMALAAKEEEAARAREARLEARAQRLGLRPRAVVNDDAPAFFGLSFDGRMGRFAYLACSAILYSVLMMALLVFLQKPSGGRAAFLALAVLALTFVNLRQTALRLHDFNRSGWWSLVTFVPVVGQLAMIVIALCPGSADENDFGAPPREWHGGIAAAAIAMATLLLSLSWAKFVHLASMAESSADDDPAAEQTAPSAAPPPSLKTREQQAAFETYRAARPHRAFAISPAGGWGWAGDRATPRDAVMAAFQDCESRRPAYSDPCELVEVNGQRAPGQ